ncbi:hypothetical protein RhiLY_07972 [Ceratobasidium sp. AG-Ba]|nr:hypothetical protein RhiLY_07972 [Ceratobasidium sp. AG-Ba]
MFITREHPNASSDPAGPVLSPVEWLLVFSPLILALILGVVQCFRARWFFTKRGCEYVIYQEGSFQRLQNGFYHASLPNRAVFEHRTSTGNFIAWYRLSEIWLIPVPDFSSPPTTSPPPPPPSPSLTPRNSTPNQPSSFEYEYGIQLSEFPPPPGLPDSRSAVTPTSQDNDTPPFSLPSNKSSPMIDPTIPAFSSPRSSLETVKLSDIKADVI